MKFGGIGSNYITGENNVKFTSADDFDGLGLDYFGGLYVKDKDGKDVARWLIWNGDVNGDLCVDPSDTMAILRASKYPELFEKLENYEKLVMDLNHDGKITSADVKLMLRVGCELRLSGPWRLCQESKGTKSKCIC